MPATTSGTRVGSVMTSHTASGVARTSAAASTLTRPSSEDRQPALGGQLVEAGLHVGLDLAAHPAGVGVRPEAGPHVDGIEDLDGDLGGEREVAEEVPDVQAPWQGDRDRQHLQPEEAVD